ncbi:hypothetical protein SDC9_86370 [bioreactor metagenome]|uniref:Uncharacterized protein n=1 Tax=bioreactor metagenome TaxID=1076179 RepID=A0A644ZFX4_9ZZZZ
MGQLSDISHDAVSADILAHSKGHGGFVVHECTGFHHVPDQDGGHVLVGHLDAHHGDFIGDGRDADAGGPQRQRNIVRQIGDLGELHTLVQHKFIPGNGGSVNHLPRRGLHAEALQRLAEAAGVVPKLGPGLRKIAARVFVQQSDGGELIVAFAGRHRVRNLGRDLGGGSGNLDCGGFGLLHRSRHRDRRGHGRRCGHGRRGNHRRGHGERLRRNSRRSGLDRLRSGLCRFLRQKLVRRDLLVGFLAEKALEQAGLLLRIRSLFAIQRDINDGACLVPAAGRDRRNGGRGARGLLRLRLVPDTIAVSFRQSAE